MAGDATGQLLSTAGLRLDSGFEWNKSAPFLAYEPNRSGGLRGPTYGLSWHMVQITGDTMNWHRIRKDVESTVRHISLMNVESMSRHRQQ